MLRRTIQIVSNPAAGTHCVRKVAELAAALERAGAEVIQSQCGPGSDVCIADDADHLCVVGGDGTVRHAAQAAARAPRPIGMSLYPAGTINLLHRETPCDLDLDVFARRIVTQERQRNHFAAGLGEGLFLACASVGPDSAAVATVSSTLKRRIGRLAYGVAFLKILAKWRRPRITLRANGRTIACEAFYVAKSRYFAGPWSFAPKARGSDPLMHVVALTRASRWRYARFLLAMLTGGAIARVPGAVCFACTELRADCDEPLPVQADGDVAATLPVSMVLRKEPILFV
jgi:diacylglycerol kinase (ATP)